MLSESQEVVVVHLRQPAGVRQLQQRLLSLLVPRTLVTGTQELQHLVWGK